MSNQILRFTGFKDPSGADIFEGDYLILNISNLTEQQQEERHLPKLIELFDIQYMQAYIKPTGQLRCSIDLILVNSKNKALTDSEFYYAEDDEGKTLEQFMADYPKNFGTDQIYVELVLHHFSLLKSIIADNLWFKREALVNRENVND